ncbi:unnamed protein product [Didymodactylos carnosus]|uniref:Translation initiation factor beta propellor-like domain-containing protein n=1 Tax=Didymodactylos carnosus TaxID=1234261 RepID=A0A8S2GK72_9BILA|nr:unnamed protein product [Didymodactylos carnosus]CAF3510301.1 unnamed protein product [Didymodactylos carnosus]
MPSKATMFNSKCDISWELSVGAKNAVYYNTDGTYLALCGFGNVSGNIEMWDVKARKQLIHINVPDTTYFQWCYDNYHFITATTAPRLRVNNGFKIWRLTGELIFEHRTSDNQELWQVLWQPGTYNRGNKQPIASDPSSTTTNISSKQKTPQAYRPPHLRNTTRQVPKLHDEVPAKQSHSPKPNQPVSHTPRVPKPDGLESLLTGDLEKDKKIRQIHKKPRR